MKENTLHKTRENQINNVVRAPNWEKQLFSGLKILSGVVSMFVITIVVLGLNSQSAESKRVKAIDFGTERSVNIFPAEVDSEDWSFDKYSLSQDLNDSSLYQSFNANNSASLPKREQKVEIPNQTSPAGNDSSATDGAETSVNEDISSEITPDISGGELNDSEPVSEVTDETPDVSEPIQEIMPEEAVSEESVGDNLEQPTSLNWGVFEETSELFPLAHVILTASSEVTSTTPIELVDNHIHEEEVIIEDLNFETATPTVATSTQNDAAGNGLSSTTLEQANNDGEIHEIVLSNFDTAPLEPGQFVNGMQLRMSLGGQLITKVPEGRPAPYVEVLFGTSGSYTPVGNVLLEDEVSNALNGGYYLFALPDELSVEDLASSSVVIRYHGDDETLDGLYLDSLWLELDTRIVTKEDLLKRGQGHAFEQLAVPERSSLLSEQLNFARTELPTFNLRYNSQRNAFIRGMRTFIGSDLVTVEDVRLRHKSQGYIGVTPVITTTSEGLLTIEIEERDKAIMPPGTYEVEILYNEGGRLFTDGFDFQWGIITLNPNKSEYKTGETAHISIGALTPNGHTICDAVLDLYVIDPVGNILRPDVTPSGQCNGNNVIDVPDFSALVPTTIAGTYELYLERLDDLGNVLGYTTDTFLVADVQNVSIERDGPTRIYPLAPYTMELRVESDSAVNGIITERVPREFVISNTDANITEEGDFKILSWDISVGGGSYEILSYTFDAPDISPYLFNLGPAVVETEETNASTSESNQSIAFEEHREWQIASDAVGNMLLFWANGASVPAGWTCVSCVGGDPFYQRFIMGSSTGNVTGGATTHTHTAVGSVIASGATGGETGSGGAAPVGHSHSYTPTIGTASNLPLYRQLRVIEYTAAAGEPTTIPAGAIAIFDVASSSLPVGWNRYAAQDGYYVYGENTPGTTGGSNTHTHAISGTTGAPPEPGTRTRGGTANSASTAHTHTVSGTTGSVNHEPRYIEVLLAQASSNVSPTNGIIAMWDEDVDGGWLDVSSVNGDPFNQRFIKPATTYGTTNGNSTHTHSDVNGLTSSGPNATANTVTGAFGTTNNHTHTVNVTTFSTTNHLPPFRTVVFGKRQGTDPVFEQTSSRWYVNINNQTPTDEWPLDSVQALDLAEREPITSTSTPIKVGDEVRLRLGAQVTNATSSAGSGFKLQYAPATGLCSAASGWTDVGATASSTIWRGYNNTSVSNSVTLTSQLLASTTVSETYEENGYTASTPNDIEPDDYAEWDFVLQHNSAVAGTNYCFRLVEIDGTVFFDYGHYPQLFTNEKPDAPIQEKLFDNEKTPSTTPWFQFYASDAESDKVHYEIEVDNNYDFSSPVLDRNTISHDSEFENQVLISDKAPFRHAELIEFVPTTALTNGTTYYWRVRAQDPDASQEWSDWSSVWSFTVDTSLTASTWFQTEDEQFDSNSLVGVETASDQVALISGSSTGVITTNAITFTDGELGTAWDELAFSDTETTGDIKYQIEYYDGSGWALIPNADLAGNSTGFDTSPVSLLSLDVNTYGTIRLLANFTNSGGSPSLQDWTVRWGYRVETPTIAKLFSSEQIGTTTPTFEFTTTDPQNNDLTYQISWSTTPDFTSSTTRTSDTHSGFENIDVGGNFDPFNSGDSIQFTIQTGDALTSSTTYWWRVRAKDTTGDDAYSFWTEPQSFTMIPGTEVSTWLQTTSEQFDSNILSGTVSLSTDVVTVATTASEAMLVYGEGTETAPRYREWDGSAWSSEGNLGDVGAAIRWVVVRAAPTREEYVAATVGTDSDVNAQVFATGSWGNLQEMTVSMGSLSARGFDIAYETLSGDAMVVYCDGAADPSYRIWNGSSWSAEATINLATANACEWIQLASDPVSDEIIILSRESTGGAYEAQVWNGSSWGNSTTLGSITDAGHEGMAVMYEESGGQALIVSSDGNPARFRWNSWNGTTWGTAATVSIGDDLEWAKLVRDVGSDEMMLCYQDEDTNIGTAHWSGSAWSWAAGDEHLTTTGKAKNDPGFACAFEDTSGRNNYELTVFTDTTQTNYIGYNNTNWTAPASTQINSIGDAITMQLIRTGVDRILGVFFDETNDSLLFSSWNGTSWSTTETLETNASVGATPYGEPYFIAPRNDGSEGTTIVTPGIDFNDGAGPYWESFSWNDSQPGTSEIRYYLQYESAPGVWSFIPDGVLDDATSGTTTGPFDLSGLNTNTYNVLRPYAELTCDGSNNCPSISDWKIEWAGGINISGTAQQYDESTNVNSGTVAVAVNGVLQTGKTGTISGGNWSIDNVTAFMGDIVTVFITGAANANEAVGVARYDGQGDISGMTLYERHLTIGSNDATTTVFTNAEIGQYDFTNTEDIFFDLNGTAITVCADSGCADAELQILSGAYYAPGGRIVTHDFENNGTFIPGSQTIEVNGSWDNNATTTMTNSTVVFAATSTNETIDSTGAVTPFFNNITFGTTTGNGTWTLSSTLDVNGNMTVSRGTLARGGTAITVAGNLTNGANGFWTGRATTTFDGTAAGAWSDQNATLQNIGYVVVDGTSKVVSLAGNVAAQTVTIGANDTLDASTSNYDITVYGSWLNQNNFLPRSGQVNFSATSTFSITTAGDAFYDVVFNGASGAWSFTESTLLVNNDVTISNGNVTLPTGTTTIAGSFNSTGGNFAHSNGTLYFTSNSAETITFAGGLFTNVAHILSFNGAGSWTFAGSNATSTNDVRVAQGTVNFPSGVMALGGSLVDSGGSFTGGTGQVTFYSTASEIIRTGGSSFNDISFNGSGTWTFTDATGDVNGDFTVFQGTTVLPSTTLTIGGSYTNNSNVTPGTGTVTFDSTDNGETIDFGDDNLYNVIFNGNGGGWTVTESATTTNNFTIATGTAWTLSSGRALSVGGQFTNSLTNAATTWTGSTLSLESGTYSINSKTSTGDTYGTLRIAAAADISMWNSSATSYAVNSSGSLYSQDHAAINGDLYIFGAYARSSGGEYWAYNTDFDGTALGGSPRQVDVRFASGASASLSDVTFVVGGQSTASTTIANQGSGTYTVNVSGGTTTAQYYEFTDLGSTGVSFTDAAIVSVLRDGEYTVGANAGSALTLSSTTIDANPAKQIYNITFATSTAISANNVTQSDGTPTSYWWFRNGYGNLYGEAFDNDTGDPGSVRFDDSSLVINISGTVYSDAGTTAITGGTCDGATDVVRVMVNGVEADKVPCSNVDGTFTASGIVIVGDPTVTVYLDNASGGQRGSVVTRTPTGDITGLNIYANRVIVRNEDAAATTIANLAVFDFDNDSDLRFIASTTTEPDTLTTLSGTELFIYNSSTFAPGGNITLSGNAQANSYDGTLYVDDNATFTGVGTSTYTVGGRFVLDTGATFTSASTSVVMNATTTGKSVTSSSALTFYNLSFIGSGGGWNLGSDITVGSNMTVTAGTVTGTEDITLTNGSLSGNGVLSLGGGTTTLARTNTLGGTSAWTFYNLVLGNGATVGTTTPAFTSTTTVSSRLTIANAHFLDAGDTNWDLAGTGTVFVETGTFLQDTSRVRYSGNGSNVLSTQYYDLDINAGAGTPTYTAVGSGVIVDNDLTVGGTAATTFNINTNDPLYDINGDVIVRGNGTLVLSDTAIFRVAGDYDNNGTVTANGGRVTFDGAGATTIAAGNSSFANVTVLSTGNVTVTEHATATANWLLAGATTFTLNSGQSLAVGGQFHNGVAGGVTTWTGSTLRLYGGQNYLINAATSSDSYATLDIDDTTQIRMWSSQASSYSVASGASLYSQDHAAVDGDLYIWGAYRKTSGNDYWSYAYDFDGTALGGSSRKVDVFFAPDASVSVTGGRLAVYGSGAASTTLQTQGGGDYSILVGGSASSSFRYYETRDIDSNGLVFTGTPTIGTLSNGDLEVSVNAGTAITVGGSVISANPAKNFNLNRFALDGVGSGFNVTATGTSVSSWRFANHFGDIDGESFDVDPDGDPGYVAWDDSAALITISGTVYADDTTTVSSACASGEIRLMVAGISSATTSCNVGTGAYTFNNISYGPTDSLIVYIDGVSEKGATVTKAPISNISSLNIYENHVIVRHENTDPITIADMAVWDSSDDADIPFTAVDAGTDTLTLPADRKLIVWTGKEFEPNGNVTLTNGGSETYGGSLELFANALWTGQGTEALSVGGSMTLGSSATFDASNGTTTFTTSGAGRTIDVNESSFNNIAFTGSGSWTISDTNTNIASNYQQTGGTVTLSTGSTTVAGSFINNGGTFTASGGELILTGTGSKTLRGGGSSFAEVVFAGGTYTMSDTNATATESVTILSGTVSLPSGFFSVGGDFVNEAGAITHNTSEIVMRNATAALLQASSSDLYAVTFNGGGDYTIVDSTITFLDSLTLDSGTLELASTTTTIGGSFDASGGTFTAGSSTVLFNSSDGGEIINAGTSSFYNLQIGAPTGGYSLVANATTTNNFNLANATNFTAQSGVVLKVEGVFTNAVGGSATTWAGSTLALDGENAYSINTKSSGGDRYQTLIIGNDSDIRSWNSVATTTTVAASASLYSQDHSAVDGDLYIYGDFHIPVVTEYWSYATDFDGTSLSGSERDVTVAHANGATTTLDGGTLNIVGAVGNETTITNQSSGTYGMNVSGGTFNAQYYEYRNLAAAGLNLSGTPVISSLSNGDFELAVNGGSLITLSSTTLNANASLVISDNRFATTTAITGYNVTLTGTTPNAWTFVDHIGNLDGEDFNVDGATACGSVRWDDSSCLLTQQTNYRWRNDDGGIGVPNAEWFNSNWEARKRVRLINGNSSATTDAAVQLFVAYDADMQADFEDLLFTDDTGTTLVPHWIGSTTDNVMTEVWVKVPTLAANDTTSVFMYYNNPTATSSSNVENTFTAGDDFEDDDISEYSGQTALFNVGTTFAFDGTYGLDNDSNETSRANLGGIYRTDQPISQNETIRFMQYIDTAGTLDEICTKFAIQATGIPNDNYAVCVEFSGTDRISLVRDVTDNEASGTLLDSTPVSFSTGWYEFEVDWSDVSGGTLDLSMYDAGGTLIATSSATDSNYTTGGYGFTFWYNLGGWDSFSSRPLMDEEPIVLFGDEQTADGASWKASQNSSATYSVADIARLRIAIENTGVDITNQQFLLEYAAQDSAPSCEAVDPTDYVAVPIQASCGTSPVCMQSSTYVTNGASTFDLLSIDENEYSAGETRENPTNITGNIDVDQNFYTELEYVITPTVNVVDQNLCFRVTNNGTDYDTYLRVARMQLRFDPILDTPTLNDGADISLVSGTTTRVYATTTVTDLNGYADITNATSTFFRSGVGAGCSPDNNNCYISSIENAQCSFTNCAGDSCVVECYADIFFHADPTASSSIYEGQEWLAFIEAEDANGGYDFDTSDGQEVNILRAIDVDGNIDYGSLAVNSDTGSDNATTSILNIGNVEIDIEVQGTDLSDGYSSVIGANEQKFSTSTFTYSACGTCALVSSTTWVVLGADLVKPTTDSPPVEEEVYWGIEVPIGISSSPHQGYNVFTPISP